MNISEFCKIYTGTGFPIEFQGKKNGKYPFYKVSDISVNNTQQKIFLDNANNYIDEFDLSILKGNLIPAGTIVFAKIGEALKLNKRAITSCECLIDNNVIGIKPDDNIINLLYFYYYLLKIDMLHYSESTTLPSVRKSTIEKIKVKIPPIDVQNKRVTILNICHKIIKYQVELIHNLDLLVKSRFVEIFGAFNINCNNYNTIKFKDLIEQNNINEEDMVWLLNLDMIKPNTGEIIEKVYINRQNIPTSSISFNNGTVLYSKLRPYLNKVVIADENGYGTSELIPLNSYKNGLTAEYLAYYLRQDSFVEYIKDKVTGAKMPRVAMDILRNIDIIKPNYISQEQFSSFVNHINKLKSDVQKSIDETQLLMDSLMQEYFG